MYNVTLSGADQGIPQRGEGSKGGPRWVPGLFAVPLLLGGGGGGGGGTQPPSPDDISQGLTQDVIYIQK